MAGNNTHHNHALPILASRQRQAYLAPMSENLEPFAIRKKNLGYNKQNNKIIYSLFFSSLTIQVRSTYVYYKIYAFTLA